MPRDRIFMPLTNPRLPRAVLKFPYCLLSGLILYDIPRQLTFELDHERKCTYEMVFFIFYSFFYVHVHVWASLAVKCNECVIYCGFGQNRTQYTPSRLRRSGVYRTVLVKAAVNNNNTYILVGSLNYRQFLVPRTFQPAYLLTNLCVLAIRLRQLIFFRAT